MTFDDSNDRANYALTPSGAGAPELPAPDLAYQPPRPKDPQLLGIGILGCGGIAETHAAAYQAAGFRVVAVCDHTPAKAEKLAASFDVPPLVLDDADAVFAHPEIAVVDLTPHPADRVSLIRDALLAGRHVLSQKPFVLDLDVGEELVRLAEQCGCHLAVNQNGRWAPHFSFAREAVQAGLLGPLNVARLAVAWDHNWIRSLRFNDMPDLLLVDFAIHWFDFINTIFAGRKADRIWAHVTRSPSQTAKPPLLGQVMIDFGDAQASITLDADTPFAPEDRTVLIGPNGTLRSWGPSLSEQTVRVTTRLGYFEPSLVGSWFVEGFAGTMGELLVAIEENRPPRNSAADNLMSLALAFAAIESSRIGHGVVPGSVRRLNHP